MPVLTERIEEMAEQNVNEELDEILEQTDEAAEETAAEEETPEVEVVEEDEAEAPGDEDAEKAEKKSFFKKKTLINFLLTTILPITQTLRQELLHWRISKGLTLWHETL